MTRSRKLRRAGLALIGLLCALWLINPADARAGGYRVYECYPGVQNAVPDAVPSGDFDGSSTFWGYDCSDQAAWGLTLEGYGSALAPHYAQVTLTAPQGAFISTGSYVWSHAHDAYDTWGTAFYVLGNSGQVLDSRPGGYGNSQNHVGYSIPDTGGQGRTLALELSCNQPPGYLCTGYDQNGILYLSMQLVDTAPPQLSLPGGSLLQQPAAHGLSTLRVSATDNGGGILTARAEVNGQSIPGPSTSCPGWAGGGYGTQMRPCGNLDQTITVDTERTPWREGANQLQVCVTDAASAPDAPHSVCEQRTIYANNSCPDSSGADRLATALSAGLEDPKSGALRRTRAVRSTDGVALRGSLSAGGAPVRGASVCIYEQVDEPAGIKQLVQVAKSNSAGNFGVNLPPGPSRSFEVAYRYGDEEIGTPSMYLDSSVVPILRVSKKKLRNGRSVRFRGHLPGPHADGVAVALQAKVGKKWRTFKQLTSDQSGSFRGKYRFTQTHGSVRYVFRALVKKQGGYPFSQGASRKRKVLVRG